MRSPRSVSRVVGGLLILQMMLLILPFVLLHPITAGSQAFLANAAPASGQITAAVFLLFFNSAVTIGISIALFPIVSKRSERMALWLLAASIVWFALQAVDNAHILSIVALSQRFVDGGSANADLYQAMGATLGGTRRWVHYSELLVIDCWMFSLYAVLYRFAFVPRLLSAFALLTVVLHFAGIPLLAFLGYGIITPMGVPLAASQLAIASWLLVKGLADGDRNYE
jgi:hypothetical protein